MSAPARQARDPILLVPETQIPDLRREQPSVLGYRRVSRREQATEWKDSLRSQTAAQISYASVHSLAFNPDHTFEDRFSGEDAERRPAFMAMYEYCRTHPRPALDPGRVLVLCASRWGRFDDPEDAAYWRVVFRRHEWNVVYVTTDLTEDPGVRHIVRAAVDAGATFERKEIISRAKSGGRKAARLGHWQGRAPIGYRRLACKEGREPRLLDNGERSPDDCYTVLTPGPREEWEFMQWVFETFAHSNHSLTSFVKLALDRRRTAGPGGGMLRDDVRWTKAALRQKLQNITYLGTIRFGRKLNQSKRRAIVVDDANCVIVQNAHPALVSQDTFDLVQARLAKNAKKRKGVRTPYALSGIVTCAECGSIFRGAGGRRGPAGKEARYRTYLDVGRLPGRDGEPPVCPGAGGTISRVKLETAVIRAITELVQTPGIERAIRAAIQTRLGAEGDDGKRRLRELEHITQDTKTRRQRLVEAVETGTLSFADVGRRLKELDAQDHSVTAERAQLSQAKRARASAEEEAVRLLKIARDFPAVCRRLEGHDLRELLLPWIHSAVFDKRTRVMTLTLRRVPGVTSRPASVDQLVVRRFSFGQGHWWAKAADRTPPARVDAARAGGRATRTRRD